MTGVCGNYGVKLDGSASAAVGLSVGGDADKKQFYVEERYFIF